MTTSVDVPSPANRGRSAAICLALAATVGLAIVFVPWMILGHALVPVLDGVMAAIVLAAGWLFGLSANVLTINGTATLAITISVLCAMVCMNSKSLYNSIPQPDDAPWQKILSKIETPVIVSLFSVFLIFGIAMIFISVRSSKDYIVLYQELMQTPPGLPVVAPLAASDGSMSVWSQQMGRDGEVVRNNLRRVCVEYVNAMPANSLYVLTINGRPGTANNCGWSMSKMVWRPAL